MNTVERSGGTYPKIEERIVKLYRKNKSYLWPDLKGGVIVYFTFVKSFSQIRARGLAQRQLFS